ncbi:DUF302 domain-containing protein [Streptosporangium sp. 'caverna']|uniref:DUF302 domain-containing protein n=1 Tax=Streptosporangium sp. 'caverna' TaxID=2202249 RepID=UPI0019550BE2|nr:DUF302 domain-containing protein [Streptosporangium sp. 'caverna']
MTQQTGSRISTVPHEVNRLTVRVDAPFQEFRERYERAVPPFDAARFEQLIKENADWDTVLRATTQNAPHDFIIYWKFDATPIMRLAGDRWLCVEYLMGNHTIAQRMYHHDPAIMLYAPLRTMIYEDSAGATRFAVDQPSTRFSSFGDPDITEVGLELDRELAALLEHLEAPVPAELVRGRVSHG